MGVLLVLLGMVLGSLLAQDPSGGLAGGMGAFVLWLVLWAISLRRGDDILLSMAGAREIEHGDHPTLFNVVEEMSIAAQLGKRPRVFIVDDPSPNAFAAGRDPAKAGVAVTTGLLRILDRDELQGVIAHELGHIKNRDVALIATAGVMMGSIVLLTEIGLRVFHFSGARRSRSSNGDGNGAQAIVMVVALLLVVLSPILAQLLYFALSRRREYLADASGAMFTRYPEGLARALEKLGGAGQPLSDTSKVTAPMYIVQPVRAARGLRAGWLATHPPLEERVSILRGMAGGADFRAYDQAFRAVAGGSIVGEHTLEATSHVDVRPAGVRSAVARPVVAQPVDAQLAVARKAVMEASPPLASHARARQASDAFLSASGYIRRECTQCAALVKIPAAHAQRDFACPRCDGRLGPNTAV